MPDVVEVRMSDGTWRLADVLRRDGSHRVYVRLDGMEWWAYNEPPFKPEWREAPSGQSTHQSD